MAPPAVGVGAPILSSAIGSVSSVKGITGETIGTADPATRSARRMGATPRTDTHMSDSFALPDSSGVVCNGSRRKRTTRTDYGSERRHDDPLPHSNLLSFRSQQTNGLFAINSRSQILLLQGCLWLQMDGSTFQVLLS